MAKLAINGGTPVHTTGWSGWPVRDETEIEALTEVANSGVWGHGPKVKEFEQKFAEYMDAKYGVCVNSGTTSLIVPIIAAGVRAGDEVIIPPYTFIATATAVLAANGTPVFADLDADNYCLNPESVEQVITDKTKAILTVHLGGCPTDMDAIMELAKKHNLIVVEDCSHAHGARYKGKGVGALGDMGGFSFQASKNLNCGEGGITLTNDRILYDRCAAHHNVRRLSPEAINEISPGLNQRLRLTGGIVDDIIGTNFRMTEFQAAILLAQFERLEEQSNLRDGNGMYLTEQLRQINGIKVPRPDYVTRHGYHLFVYTYESEGFNGLPFSKFREAMNAEGIPCGGGYSPLYNNSIFQGPIARLPLTRKSDYYSQLHLPVVEELSAKTAWMSQSTLLCSRKDMEHIIEAVGKIKENLDELL